MPSPDRKSVQLWARVSQPTYDTLVDLAASLGLCNGRVNFGALFDMVVAQLQPIVAEIPKDQKYDRGRKLSAAQVRMIRASTDKFMCIAMEHGIDATNVGRIRRRRTYKWVK